jgi:hypothetical protein
MLMITVDGEPVPRNPSDSGDHEETVRTTRLELKLCKALAALDPPHELSTILHARITEQLRRLRRYDANDQEVRQACDLTDSELREAAGIIRAIRALPSWSDKTYSSGTGFRVVLSGYALDLTDEIDKRADRLPQELPRSGAAEHASTDSGHRPDL